MICLWVAGFILQHPCSLIHEGSTPAVVVVVVVVGKMATGEALNFLLLAIVTGIAAFLAYFGNGP